MNPLTDSDGSPLWFLYVLDCDGRLYTGVTTDVSRRLAEHRSGNSRAARFTRGAREISLCYQVPLEGRSEALRAEARFRRLKRASKWALIAEKPDRVALLERLGLAPQ